VKLYLAIASQPSRHTLDTGSGRPAGSAHPWTSHISHSLLQCRDIPSGSPRRRKSGLCRYGETQTGDKHKQVISVGEVGDTSLLQCFCEEEVFPVPPHRRVRLKMSNGWPNNIPRLELEEGKYEGIPSRRWAIYAIRVGYPGARLADWLPTS